MSNLSLQASVQTCKVNTAWADRIQSDRFLNPDTMVCPPWNGFNSKGQAVCPDSFYTKNPGCNSAVDRVDVENYQRPQYSSYITLNAAGIDGNIYGGNSLSHQESVARQKYLDGINDLTGNFGTQFGSNLKYTGCTVGAYERAMASQAQQHRQLQSASVGHTYNNYRNGSGM